MNMASTVWVMRTQALASRPSLVIIVATVSASE